MPATVVAHGPNVASHWSGRWWRRYKREALRPIHCILVVLPMAILYEISAWTARAQGPGEQLLTHSAIQELLTWFGFGGFWVPGVVLLVTLFLWHRQSGDHWRVRAWAPPAMLVESLLLALPLLLLTALFRQTPALGDAGIQVRIVQALGAGVYEELVFRLLLMGAVIWALAVWLRAPRPVAVWVAVGLSAVLFSTCHFDPLGLERFTWGAFWFRLAAGLYLSAVFVGRGLGVATGTHAAFDILLAAFGTSSASGSAP